MRKTFTLNLTRFRHFVRFFMRARKDLSLAYLETCLLLFVSSARGLLKQIKGRLLFGKINGSRFTLRRLRLAVTTIRRIAQKPRRRIKTSFYARTHPLKFINSRTTGTCPLWTVTVSETFYNFLLSYEPVFFSADNTKIYWIEFR